MSRHRTTAKMHRANSKQDAATPAETVSEASTVDEPRNTEVAAAGTSERDDVLTVEKLGRYLAAEISQREVNEERTTSFLARYFKLNLVMAGVNIVVAVACVAMLLGRSDKPQTIVVAPPVSAPPAQPPAPPQPTETAQLALPPAAALVVPAPAAAAVPAAATQPPAKLHLLGEPSVPVRRRASNPGLTQTPQVASKPVTSKPLVVARNVDEGNSLELSKQTERW